jgi:hypothetical protein
MKKYILLFMLLAPCSLVKMQAQNYFVSSLATPGAATFTSEKIANGVISLPFAAGTHTIQIETNQQDATVSSGANWCQASFADKKLTLTVTENTTEDARTTILSVRSKDFRPLLITVRQEARLTFAVISDVHVGDNCGIGYQKKIPQALQHLTAHGKLDAMAVVGDLTNGGTSGQYKEFVKFFSSDQNILNPIDNFLFMMGNHDNYPDNNQGISNYENGLKPFNGNNSYPLDQYVLIKGYPFITISCRAGYNNDDNTSYGTASYPTAVVNTLKRYLKQAAEDAPGKPIFVFTHVAPRNTCYSTWGDLEGVAWAMWRLNSVLNEYPQVVAFCGHSHYPLGDPRSIHQGANPNSTNKNYYTVINTASTTYSEINPGAVDAGIHPENYTKVTEGMIIVELSSGDIEIRRYDTYRGVEIDPEHRWILKAPFDGSKFQYADIRDANDNPNNVTLRTGLPAPVFDKDAKLSLKATTEDLIISFPQATDNECVFRYNIRVLKDNTLVKSNFVFSQFYLSSGMPKRLSYIAEELAPNTEYTVEVVAYDSYDNQSTPLTATIKTPAEDEPIPDAIGAWTFDDTNDLLAGTGVATLTGAVMEMGSIAVTDNLASIGITPVAGQAEGNGAITIPVGSGLMMTSNLEEESLSSYTYMFDIRSEQLDGYTAIYQNDITNTSDGSFFIKNGQLGLNSNGLGYNGNLTSGKWHRVVLVAKNNAVIIYLDGRQIGQSSSANAGHWQMSTGALFFIDDNEEEHVIESSEIRFWDIPLSSKQIFKLGTATEEEVPEPDPIPEAIGVWTFDNVNNLMAGTGVATLKPATHTNGNVKLFDNPADANITSVAGPAENNSGLAIPKGSSLMMASNLGVESMSTYSVMWDIRANDLTDYSPLLQNGLTNAKDGSLFIKNGQVGLNTCGLGYNGSLTTGKWHRVMFVVENNYGTVYIDGKKVGQSTSASQQHWQLSTGALFFADNDGEEKAIETAEIRFWNVALDGQQVATIGAAGNNFEQEPDPDAVPVAFSSWTFDNPNDPLARTGGTGNGSLHPYKKESDGTMYVTGRFSEANLSTTNGPTAGNYAVYAPVNSSLLMMPGLKEISTYSFLMDVKLDDTEGFAALFQNQITNKKDASLFVKDGQIGLNTAGLGYNGTINAGQWHRIVFVAENNHGTVYIDGQKVVQSIDACEEHWFMQAGLVFFADQDGEEKPVTISELSFWDKPLTDKQVWKLGTVAGGEAQEPAVPEATGAWTFDNPNNHFAGTGTSTITGWQKLGNGIYLTGPYDEEIPTVDGPTANNGAVLVPVGYGLQMTTNLEATSLDTYSWLMDINLDDVSSYAALFQNDDTNEKDASLFIKDGQVGVAGQNGTGYHGTIKAGKWHRVVFVVNKNFGFVFIDGVKVGRSTRANVEHWEMGKRALFFIDNDGEEKDVKTAEIRFWNKALLENQIEILGGVPME